MDDDRCIRSDEARRNFRGLLNEVEHGGTHVTILRYDTPAAVIVPVEWHRAAVARLGELRAEAADAP